MFARGALGNPFIFSAARSLLLTGSYSWPEPEIRLKTAFEQLELLARDMGEYPACREMRKQFCAYTKGPAGVPGIPGGARLRDELVKAESAADYRRILSPYH
jgi:tRNA-dihydrouridine synthase